MISKFIPPEYIFSKNQYCRNSDTGTLYALVTSGSNCTRITSLWECSFAAEVLGLSDTTATDDNQSGVHYDPPYCYFESSILQYNSNGLNTGSCSGSDKCICAGNFGKGMFIRLYKVFSNYVFILAP